MDTREYAVDGASEQPYQMFRDHGTAGNPNTESLLLEAFLTAYPHLHITPVKGSDFDILGWAKAGNANVSLIRDNNRFIVRRGYEAAENRLEDNDGVLSENVRFGLYHLVYDSEQQYLRFYVVEWLYSPFGKAFKMFYLLSSKDNVDEAGQSVRYAPGVECYDPVP